MLSTIKIGAHSAPWLSLSSENNNAETIHFSAANGFPVSSYRHFLTRFDKQFQVSAMDCRGAWPDPANPPPRQFNMHNFADDLIAALEKQYDHPVIGMGHSMGGLLTLIAAHKRPELFSKLVLLEPASLPNAWIDLIYRRLPRPVLHQLFPLMKGSAERRKIWPSRAAFIERYQGHGTFKRFTPKALQEYAKYGLRETGDGNWELVFEPAWEAHIFSVVEYLWKFLGGIQHPTLLVRAEHSNLYSKRQFDKANRNLTGHIQPVNLANTHHLFPNEMPELAHDLVQSWLDKTTVN